MATRIPYEFATAGDTEEIPDTSSSDELSWQDGWSEAYAKESTEAGYRYIDRSEMNYLFKVLSANIKEWQEQIFPSYSDEISYPEGVVVRYTDGNFYTSNTVTTVGSIPSDLIEWDEYESNADLKALIDTNTTDISTNSYDISTLQSLVNKSVTVDFASDADLTLTAAQNEYGRIVLTDTGSVLTAERQLIVSNTERFLTVKNETEYAIKVVTASGTGVHVEVGEQFNLRIDGVNVASHGDCNKIKILPFDDYSSGTFEYPFNLTQSSIYLMEITTSVSSAAYRSGLVGFVSSDQIEDYPAAWDCVIASISGDNIQVSYVSTTSFSISQAGDDVAKEITVALKDGVTY